MSVDNERKQGNGIKYEREENRKIINFCKQFIWREDVLVGFGFEKFCHRRA